MMEMETVEIDHLSKERIDNQVYSAEVYTFEADITCIDHGHTNPTPTHHRQELACAQLFVDI